MDENEQPPALPSYGVPEPVKTIHKPGMLNKMMSKMMKTPKAPKTKTALPRVRSVKKKRTHQKFY